MNERLGRFSSTTLAGEDLTLPDDLDGMALIVVAYQQRQQPDVDSWLAALGDADVRFLEVPVLGRRWLPAKLFINGGMASNMDQRTRERTMCVYTDVDRFRRDVLGTASEEVAAVLVEADGTVHWSSTGPATTESAAALRSAIRS